MFTIEESRVLADLLSQLPFPESRYAGIALRAEDAQPFSSMSNLPPNVLEALFGQVLLAAGSFNPAQARVAKGNPDGGQWLQTAGPIADGLAAALNRSMNRLDIGADIGERELPGTAEEVRAERRRMAAKVLQEEGRPSLDETAARVDQIYGMTTPEQREAGKVWYDQAGALADQMVEESGGTLTREQAAAVIAHLSTQTRWEANADYARSVAAGRTQDEALAHLRAEVAAGRIPKPKQGGDFLLDTNWAKAQSAAVSDDPIGRENKNLGTFSEKNKTRTFADNIIGDRDGVTVDAWMQRVIGQEIMPKGKVKGKNQIVREDQIYEALSEAVRVAADKNGISPAEMQAVTWSWALENYVATRKGHPGRFVDKGTGTVLPDMIGGEQALIDSGDLVAAAAPEFEDTDEMPDYWYAMAEQLLGIVPPERELTAAGGFNEAQRRVAKGNREGGQWVDDAGTIADGLEQFVGPAGVSMSYAEMKAMGHKELSQRVNPGFWTDPPTADTPRMYKQDALTRLEYVMNCQRTCMAVEMQARGYNVVANGAPKGVGTDWAPDGTDADIAACWRQTRDALPDGVAGEVAFGYPQPPREAYTALLKQPIGSRFLVAGTWGGAGGHIWNAEVVQTQFGPQLVEIDAQTPMNLERSGGSYLLDYSDDAFTDIAVLRVDDKLPSDQLWNGGPTTGVPWVQTPADFAAENAAVRANPQQPWEYAAQLARPVTFEEARQIVAELSRKRTAPSGWDAGGGWVVGVLNDPIIYNDAAWFVDKLTGEAREAALLPGHGYAPVASLTAAGGLTQARVPKGNGERSGEWTETAGGILESLGVSYGEGHGPDAARMAEKLGAPGDPVSLSAMRSDPYGYRKKINPAIGTVDHAKALTNCQRVVFATELQARGFAASAPPSKGGDRITQIEMNFKGGRRFSEPVSGSKQLAALVADDPPGSRYIVSGLNGRAGHVWNAEKGARGALTVYDGQSGATTASRSYLNWARIIRVDDLAIKDEVFEKAPMADAPYVIPEAQTP